MPAKSTAGRAMGTTIKGARLTARGGTRVGRWVGRNVGTFRNKGGAGELGMIRLLDLHAASCAGDTLVTMGLAGTIFFNVPVGEARGRVALYLLITMAPFALLAPVVGPLLDRFRHGRRYALATTMLGRAFLAWVISDSLGSVALYPAAFGVLALSRAYGVARSAAVPRLLPPGLGLSEAGARASIFGTLAGAAIAPIGVLAFWIGHPWPLRLAAVVFVAGMIIALRLPPKADSEPPEVLPRIFKLPNRESVKVLSGRLVLALLSGSAVLRALYGFLTLFLAFSIRSNDLTTTLLGVHLSQTKALAYAIGALGVGTFVATAIGSRITIHRPAFLQAGGIVAVAVAALAATFAYNLGSVIVLCLVTSIASGLAKLAVDASIQEKIPEQVRASAFAHSETLLMIAFVLGGAIGLCPFPGRVGIGIAAGAVVLAGMRAVMIAGRLRKEKLVGTAHGGETLELVRASDAATEFRAAASDGSDQRQTLPAAMLPTSPDRSDGSGGTSAPTTALPDAGSLAATRVAEGPAARATAPAASNARAAKPSRWRRMFGTSSKSVSGPAASSDRTRIEPAAPLDRTRIESNRTRTESNRTRVEPAANAMAGPDATMPASTNPDQNPAAPTHLLPRGEADQPSYHIYRPSPSEPGASESSGPSTESDS